MSTHATASRVRPSVAPVGAILLRERRADELDLDYPSTPRDSALDQVEALHRREASERDEPQRRTSATERHT